uniref:Neogenin C-terminal domain-containing protein n=1 Tax=Hucho hucho TaxID=62062 RepID=A0A4W5NIA7_9TELE
MTDTPIPRTSQDINPVDPSLDNSLLQRRNSYRGHESEDSISALAGRRGMRPKMMMPFDTQPPQRKCVFVCVCVRARLVNVCVFGICALTSQYTKV